MAVVVVVVGRSNNMESREGNRDVAARDRIGRKIESDPWMIKDSDFPDCDECGEEYSAWLRCSVCVDALRIVPLSVNHVRGDTVDTERLVPP